MNTEGATPGKRQRGRPRGTTKREDDTSMEATVPGAAIAPPERHLAAGQQVRAWRIARGWSQLELARRAQMSQGMVSHLESGRRVPTLWDLRQLARPLNIPLAELLHAAGLVDPGELEDPYEADIADFVAKLRQDAEIVGSLAAIRRSPHADAALEDITVGLRRHLLAIAREQRAREEREREGAGERARGEVGG